MALCDRRGLVLNLACTVDSYFINNCFKRWCQSSVSPLRLGNAKTLSMHVNYYGFAFIHSLIGIVFPFHLGCNHLTILLFLKRLTISSGKETVAWMEVDKTVCPAINIAIIKLTHNTKCVSPGILLFVCLLFERVYVTGVQVVSASQVQIIGCRW